MTTDRSILPVIGVLASLVTLFALLVRAESEIRELRSRRCEVAAQEPSPPMYRVDREANCVWVRTAGNSTLCVPLPTEPDQ